MDIREVQALIMLTVIDAMSFHCAFALSLAYAVFLPVPIKSIDCFCVKRFDEQVEPFKLACCDSIVINVVHCLKILDVIACEALDFSQCWHKLRF